jgi:virulence factor Mce-like protein
MRLNSERLRLELSRARTPALWLAVLAAMAGVASWSILKNLTLTSPFAHPYRVRIAVDDAKGIVPGVQKVSMAGVDIGLVRDVGLRGSEPVLTLDIDRKYAPLYRDAAFRVRPLTPLQDLYVSVEWRGTPRAGRLDARTIVPAEQSMTPVDVSRVLDTFQADTRKALAVTLEQLSASTPDNGTRLRAAFTELAPFLTVADRALGTVAERRRRLARLMTNFSGLVDAVGHRDRQLAGLIRSGNATLGELAKQDAPFAATLRELPPTMTALQGAFATLRTAEGDLDPALASLLPVADRLPRAMRSLQTLSGAADPALLRLRPALAALAPLARDLRPTSSALASAFTRLRPQAPSFDRITAQIPPCFEWVSRFFNDTLSVFKFADAFGTIPRGNNTSDPKTSFGGTGTGDLKQYAPCTRGGSR